ncbi:dihydroxyacetone kinase subunit DhaK [Canibacter zhuwentaonis]|uniref:dihydroxyacetone kinase subunit DhaK n=1 Tax=Canibacter zhuwentaonis TaxID=2837491 RepID=UPI0032B5DEA6
MANGQSMGVALTSCTVPAVSKLTFELPADQIEMGVGVYGEPWRSRVSHTSASEIAAELVDTIATDLDCIEARQVAV